MFDINKIPFSRYGSFIAISPVWNKEDNDLYLRSVRGGDIDTDYGKIFRVELIDNNENKLEYKTVMSEVELKLECDKGYVKFCFDDYNTLRVYGENIKLRLSMIGGSYDYATEALNNRIRVNSCTHDIRFLCTARQGKLELQAPWTGKHCEYINVEFLPEESSGILDGVIEEYKTVLKLKNYKDSYEQCLNRTLNEYKNWFENTLNVSDRYKNGKKLASYITWSCVVDKSGRLSRKAMYMSKNWMTNIWSWDNCFNAMALTKKNPELAWDQILIFFDAQDKSGVLPDFINDKYEYFSCTKPPIYGWTIEFMMKENPVFFTNERLEQIYEPLKKLTNYWFEYSDEENIGIPAYYHGNDAGWDNSTIFYNGTPLRSPDLLSFLIIQMRMLSEIAERLGYSNESKEWMKRAEISFKDLINYFWDGNKFVPIKSGVNREEFKGDSLIMFVPIILGKLLPQNIIDSLIEGLKEEGRFLTQNGLATESLKSIYYNSDGYWRGPIWAPSTMLVVDGLLKCGGIDFAKEIANRYVAMADKNGMGENFNAETGKALRDNAFTWTSSTFLLLADRFEL